ncbi:MAG: bifunctional methylenetetrahydrofolate dehydrogenase/methenyltetrahydrofolate cyclohydrolase FolD [Cyanobacteriota/Melainabacteria group bacterium]|nr:bifunctional methylenetetrahydrofolate dehydrogenase/methenyltetrahydrofolate cyclohydrolase FolD [Candidatus Obscuribacterales bacterium]
MTNTKAVEILDGKEVAKSVRIDLKKEVAAFTAAGHRAPGLAVVLVGDNPASELYVRNKIKACAKVGIESFLRRFDKDATEEQVLECIKELNQSDTVDGILVQLPLPGHLSEEKILEEIDPNKDADGLHPYNLGCLTAGVAGLRPCTPAGIITLLDFYKVPLEGASAVVIGRSQLVGKPAALLLLERNATVTICHSRTQNLDQVVRQADILVVAVGRSEFVPGSWIKPGAVVVDVGIHYHKTEDGGSKITGDVEFGSASEVAGKISPVPGGVGPMTVAQLLANTVWSYKRRLNLD